MKIQLQSAALALLIATLVTPLASSFAISTIDPVNPYAYGANLGWVDWRGDTNNGAVIGEFVCSGYLYSANVGWIHLGDGTPADQMQYQNNSASDYGVNTDSLGNLRGYAYGANIGWVRFENTGAPKVDLLTGHLSGSAFSANCGWISLSNAVASVRTTTLQPGALAPNGLPIAWLLQNFGTTNISATADADGDGASNADEFHADTSPTKASSVFRITKITRGTTTPTYMTLVWNSESSRCYAVQRKSSLRDGVWTDFIALPFLGWSAVGFDDYNMTNNFYRVRAYRPVIP